MQEAATAPTGLAGASRTPQGNATKGSLGSAVIRVSLGLTTLFTWFDNIDKDFYDGDNLPGFFAGQFRSAEEGGNGSSLGFVESILDATILQAPELFGWFMTFFELAIALALIFGVFTRAAAIAAIGFFGSLFLVYFGGEEWIWTYVLLVASSVAVFLDWGGRRFGADQFIAAKRGESPLGMIW